MGEKTLRNLPPQAAQTAKGGSDIDCTTSMWFPHSTQAYS
jgi:hypothetical protein